jgi:hypothetical protein
VKIEGRGASSGLERIGDGKEVEYGLGARVEEVEVDIPVWSAVGVWGYRMVRLVVVVVVCTPDGIERAPAGMVV